MFNEIRSHSTYSLKNATGKIRDLVDRAKELEFRGLVLTDDDNMVGTEEFMSYGTEDFKTIPGVTITTDCGRLVLIVRDEVGYRQVSVALTEANRNFNKKPILPWKRLSELFSEKGHVFATTAGLDGVLSSALLQNKEAEWKLLEIEKQMEQNSFPEDPIYLGNCKLLEKAEALLKEQQTERDSIQKKSKKLVTEEDTKRLEEVRALIERQKIRIGKIKKAVKQAEATFPKYKALEMEKKKYHILPEAEVRELAKKRLGQLKAIFGADSVFVEIEYHGSEEELAVYPVLADLAKEQGVRLVLSNDPYVVRNEEDDFLARNLVQFIQDMRYHPITEAEREDYLKNEAEMTEMAGMIFSEEELKEAIESTERIFDGCTGRYRIAGKHYPVFNDGTGRKPIEILEAKARENMNKVPVWTEEYEKRLTYELGIIDKMGYAEYHLIVMDFLEFGRKLGHLSEKSREELEEKVKEMSLAEMMEFTESHQEEAGYSIGPGRGSAAGSLVCYLAGITNLDPIRYGLLFERFLNPERVSMPDIDSDLSPEVRPLVIEYVRKRYGKGAVCSIITKGTVAAKNALKYACRYLGAKEFGDHKHYLDLGDKLAGMVGDAKHLSDLDEVFENLSSRAEKEAVRIAKRIEGTVIQYGLHAAGVIIADNEDVGEYVPLHYNEDNDLFACECDMIEAEEIGLLKMDFLGLKNLRVITNTLRAIKENTGEEIQIDKIPFEPEVFEAIFATGSTNSVFQFESGGMKQMLRRFKPTCFDDLILLVACFRPGPMQYLDDIIEVKNGRKEESFLCEELKPILGNTFGAIVYQEQVQQIFQKLAGYSLGGADLVRRAMSKKKLEKLVHEREAFVSGDSKRGIDGCVKRGISEDIANELFDQMTDFAAYAFNKSHACCYAYVAYQTAWLKYHYPTEFIASAMNNADNLDDLKPLLSDCRNASIQILPPSVNEAERFFKGKDHKIVFSLGGVLNVASSAGKIIEQRSASRYSSLADFIRRGHTDMGATESLIYAGALDEFSDSRTSMLRAAKEYVKIYKKIDTKMKELETEKDEKKAERKKKSIREYENDLRYISVSGEEDDFLERLKKEKEMTGVYLTANPLDEYTGIESFPEFEVNDNVRLTGLVTNLVIRTRKADKKPMGFFTLENGSETIECKFFTKAWEKFSGLLEDGAAVSVEGVIHRDDDGSFALFGERAEELKKKTHKMILSVRDILEWNEICEEVMSYRDKNGLSLAIYDRSMAEFRDCLFRVDKSITARFDLKKL